MTQPNPNQWSNGYSGPAPQQYPPEQLPPQQYAPQEYAPQEESKGSGWLIALIVLLLAAIIGGVAYAFTSGVFEKDGVAEPMITSGPSAGETASTSATNAGDGAGGEGKKTDPAKPSDAAAKETSGGELKRNYANYAPDTDVTSPEFAANVHAAFTRVYNDTGRTDVTVSAVSPVTGKTYSMSCSGSTTVYCTGGNNARVKIWE